MEKEYVECSCSCESHVLRFIWDPDPENPMIYASMFLNSFSFFKRLWLAIRYVFGFKSEYGHFDEIMIQHHQLKKLRDMCDRFVQTHIPEPITPEDELEVSRFIVDMRTKALAKAKTRLSEAEIRLSEVVVKHECCDTCGHLVDKCSCFGEDEDDVCDLCGGLDSECDCFDNGPYG